MKRIFRISGAVLLAGVSSLVLAPISTAALGQTATTTIYTCEAGSLAVAPASGGNLSVSCTTTTPVSGSCTVTPASQPISNGIASVSASNCGATPLWAISPTGTGIAANASSANPTIASVTVPLPGLTPATYTVTATDPNNSTSTGTASAIVTVPAISGGGTGGGTACGSPVTVPWNGSWVGVNVAGSAMAAITVPTTYPIGTVATVRTSPVSGGTMFVTYGPVTSTPCSFPSAETFRTSSGAVSYSIQIGGTSSNSSVTVLQPGQTYYVGFQSTSKTINVSINING